MLLTRNTKKTPASQPASADDTYSDADVDRYAGEVIQAGAAVRLPQLLRTPPPGTLYHVADRHGVAVAAIPTTSLTSGQIDDLLRFRFGQYLDVGFVDRDLAFAENLRVEPGEVVKPGDLHVIAGIPGTGEILCYAVIEQSPRAEPGCRLRCPDRELFPVEQVHGAGVYNRLPILPDLDVAKVREMGRFVRNHRPDAGRDLVTRAVVEIGVALFRLVAGPLSLELDAVIGDLEEHLAKANLDFFHVPTVVVHGTVPFADSTSFLLPRYRRHTVYPFAFLTSDIAAAVPRLEAIEHALAKPGKVGLLALLRLRSHGAPAAPSMLSVPEPEPDTALGLSQADTTMDERSVLLEQGAWLRGVPPFTGLSTAEAALLAARLELIEVSAGHVIAQQGEGADALFIILDGHAEVRLTVGSQTRFLGSLGPGQCCGQVSVLPDGQHPAHVTAASDMTLLCLAKDAHETCLARLPDVAVQLSHEALRLLADVDQHRREQAAVNDCGCGEDCACDHEHDHDRQRESASQASADAAPDHCHQHNQGGELS